MALPAVWRPGRAPVAIPKTHLATPGVGAAWTKHPAWRWGIALIVVVGGSVFIWQKNVDYARAAALGSASVRAFQQRELMDSLELMDRAIAAAPDVEFYYAGRAQLMDNFGTRNATDEIEIATEQHALHQRALRANPLSHTARLAAATSALKLARLGQQDRGSEALRLYEELTRMLPGYEQVYSDLASAHLVLGQPLEALGALDAYVAANGNHPKPSPETLYLRGLAFQELGRVKDALTSLEDYVQLSPKGRYAASAHKRLAGLYAELDE